MAPERSLAAWKFILCISRTLQFLRGVSLQMFSEKQTSDHTPSWTDVSYKTHEIWCVFSVVLRRQEKSWVSVKRWHLYVLSAGFWFSVSILGYWFLPSSATTIGSFLNDVPFVLLYLYLLLIHAPFTERSHFWTGWTILMKKLIKIIFSKPNAHYFLTWIYTLNRWHGTLL